VKGYAEAICKSFLKKNIAYNYNILKLIMLEKERLKNELNEAKEKRNKHVCLNNYDNCALENEENMII
jgi:hypothetical protein